MLDSLWGIARRVINCHTLFLPLSLGKLMVAAGLRNLFKQVLFLRYPLQKGCLLAEEPGECAN